MIHRVRDLICQEVTVWIEDHQTDAETWWRSLPPHIQQVYWNPDTKVITQIPILVDLLRQFDFPQLDELAEDLVNGFEMTGSLHRGSGWTMRTDDRYSYPLSTERYQQLNRQYVVGRLRCPRIDTHREGLLHEVIEELRLGRMSQPFSAPSWWPCSTVSVENLPLHSLPDDNITAAFCFSVCQSDKIRRSEDFRRSFLNQTVRVVDAPHHDDVGTFVQLLREHHRRGLRPTIWAQDLDGAYRQFPIRDVSTAYCILQLLSGPLLLRHHSLSFGAVASVWGFNRAADSVCTVRPHPPRVAKLLTQIRQVQESNKLTANEAQRLAGKMQFLASTLFGQLGGSALHPLYSRAHGLGAPNTDDSFNDTLKCSLATLATMLENIQPRHVPLGKLGTPAVLYSDAFFKQGDRTFRVGHAPLDGTWPRKQCSTFENGWGFVCHLPTRQVLFSADSVPPRVLRVFCSRKAYIYFLEIAAQFFALLALRKVWPPLIIAFIDNRAGPVERLWQGPVHQQARGSDLAAHSSRGLALTF